ncbi:hypothetical protein B0H67DRAFT_228521 [Lasiosphaeris hirsuta]|uniref:Uncharacterized protein n=1 Tax=Lasiosphaeris hirsuta TaxID=260670 RepID=A0AA40AFJ4_9PEZI|nr:hypothetical protein B0H67DRAFT_228521 [Lasiosphaeris hirsuta]
MPNRQYFCWKLCLQFRCGCSESTATQHVCNSHPRLQCYQWQITRRTNKHCETHRIDGLSGEGAVDDEEEEQTEKQLHDEIRQQIQAQIQEQQLHDSRHQIQGEGDVLPASRAQERARGRRSVAGEGEGSHPLGSRVSENGSNIRVGYISFKQGHVYGKLTNSLQDP